VFVVGLSGGKDSTALGLWAWFESGIPREKLLFTTAETSNEAELTYAYLVYLRSVFGSIQVLEPELGFYDLAKKKKRFPSNKARFCTFELKIAPQRENRFTLLRQGLRVCRFGGVRRDEGHVSNDRANTPLWRVDIGDGVWAHSPLIHWTLDDVYAIHTRYLDMDAVCKTIFECSELSDVRKIQLIARMRRGGDTVQSAVCNGGDSGWLFSVHQLQ
jgi:3'-phosphoadenosine 5'-phosphosulfate sulfotransferase (PAPS reductase)/FAD synthetase